MKISRPVYYLIIFLAVVIIAIPTIIFLTRAGEGKKGDVDQTLLIRENSRWFGGANAKVKVVEFADFQCPACAVFEPIAQEIRATYGDKIQYVFRHYPLSDVHPYAEKAAEAAECAGEQGKFFEAVDLFYKNRKDLSVDALKGYAKTLGLDETKFAQCLDSGAMAAKVKRDKEDGIALGVKATPTVYIDGRVFEGIYPVEQVKKWVNEALLNKGEAPRISSKEIYERLQKGEKIVIFDVREKNEYDEYHIPDVTHLPKSKFDNEDPELMKMLAKIPKDQMIVTYCGSGHRSGWIAINLRKKGYTNVWNLDGISYWKNYDLPLVEGPKLAPELEPIRIHTDETYYMYTNFDDAVFIDVRDPGEYLEGHIKGAINIPLSEVEDMLSSIPKDKDLVLYCSGTFGGGICSASPSAGRILISKGYKFGKIKVYEDGYGTWTDKGYPTTEGPNP